MGDVPLNLDDPNMVKVKQVRGAGRGNSWDDPARVKHRRAQHCPQVSDLVRSASRVRLQGEFLQGVSPGPGTRTGVWWRSSWCFENKGNIRSYTINVGLFLTLVKFYLVLPVTTPVIRSPLTWAVLIKSADAIHTARKCGTKWLGKDLISGA